MTAGLLVAGDVAPAGQDPLLAAGPQDPRLHAERGPVGGRPAQGLGRLRAVVGVDPLQQPVDGAPARLGVEAEDPAQLRAPGHLAAGQRPFEAAQLGHPLGLGELVLPFAAGLLGLHLGGHVLGDLGVPDEPALGVEQGGEGDLGVEAAVLADPPARPWARPPGRPGEHGGRDAGGDVVRLVEPGELLAEDLLGRVPLDPFRARVPADHPAGVEQEDRVVLDGLDQQPELVGAGQARQGPLLPALHDGTLHRPSAPCQSGRTR